MITLATQEASERFHIHAILENLRIGGCGASAPINLGLRVFSTIRLDIFSASREIETVPGFLEAPAA
jgi:hypothetical protein